MLLPAGKTAVCAAHQIVVPRCCAGQCTKKLATLDSTVRLCFEWCQGHTAPHRSRQADVNKSRNTSFSGGRSSRHAPGNHRLIVYSSTTMLSESSDYS